MVIIAEDLPREFDNIEVANVEPPAGYKMTELGLIPEDWSQVNLGDKAIKIGSGITPMGGEHIYKQSGRPFVRSQNIGDGHLLIQNIAFIDDETHESFQSTEVKVGDVLLNITGASIGRCATANHHVHGGNVNQHVCIIRPNKKELDSEFLKYSLLSSIGQRQIDSFQAGGNREGLNFGQIRSFTLLCPSLKEQQVVVAALSDIDSLITNLNQLVVKKRDIKQAAMEQLLTGKQRLPGFSGEWKNKRLGEIAFCYSGGTPLTSNLHYYNGDISWITSGDLNQRYIKKVKGRITELGLNNSSAQMVKKDSLLIALYGATAGVTAITKIDAAINQAILAVIPKNDHVDFLFHYFELRKDWLINTYTQGGQPNLSGDIVKAIEFFMPAIEEQTAIATILSDMDDEISALEQQLDKTRDLKRGMMQELLTGRIRLV